MRDTFAVAFAVGFLFSAGCDESSSDDGDNDGPLPSVSLVSPTDASILYGSQSVVVEWATENVAAYVLVVVELNDATAWTTIVPGMRAFDGTSYNWTVPDNLDTDAARFRVTCYTEPDGGGGEAALRTTGLTLATYESPDLSIRPGTITIASPTSSSVWLIGQDGLLEWTSQGPGFMELWRSTDGVSWGCIASNIDASLGAYSVSSALLPWGDTCYVRLQDGDNGLPTTDSEAFEVAGLVNSSGTPATLEVGGYMEFHANAYGTIIGNVDIELTRDGTWTNTETLYTDVVPSDTNAWIPDAPTATGCIERMTSRVTPTIFIEWTFDIVPAP